MNFNLSGLFFAFLFGLLVGGYSVTHLDEAANGVTTFRNFVIRSYHHVPACPQGFTCTPNQNQ